MKIHLPAVGPDLPVHPRTGLTALGWRRNGAPIWPVLGGAPDDDDADDDSGSDDDDGDGEGDGDGDKPEGADQLGDAGKKALAAMKAKWRKERDERKALADRLTELEAKDKSKTSKDDQPDPEEIRKKAKAEAAAETLRERVLDRIEAKAARLFADPEDAVALLGRRVDEFIDDGKVDTDEIVEALKDLLEKKPHLAAQGGGKRFEAGADGGARKGSKPDQLTRQDLKRMTPAQIVKAQEEGRLNDLMGVDT